MKKYLCLFGFLCLSTIVYALPSLQTAEDIAHFFPSSPQGIDERTQNTVQLFHASVEQILNLENRSFTNTVEAWDEAVGEVFVTMSMLETLTMVSPEEEMRQASQEALQILYQLWSKEISAPTNIYWAIHSLTHLTSEQIRYQEKLLTEFRSSGAHLPSAKQNEIQQLQNEIETLAAQFARNIWEDDSSLLCTLEELTGMSEQFITRLEREGSLYRLTCDYPIYFSIMRDCQNEKTRRELHHLFTNRAYPENHVLLEAIVEKRTLMAQELGFPNFASLSLQSQMAQTPAIVEKFLDDLWQCTQNKAEAEFAALVALLPEEVTLTHDGKINEWDMPYALNAIRTSMLGINEEEIAEYFSLAHTIEECLSLYATFFQVEIEMIDPPKLWHEDVKLLRVQKEDTVLGYVVLDLFPRKNKYGHACIEPVMLAYRDYPSLSVMVTNFTKPTLTQPSLLKHREVVTFFHEFGHAMHVMLGRTPFMSTASTQVQRDFVELPSQMMEQWMWEPSMLQRVSKHYITGAPLPEELLKKIAQSRQITAANFIQRQYALSLYSLRLFINPDELDPIALGHACFQEAYPHVHFSPENHFHASFGHLMGYDAGYYGYLWSRIFAHDLFQRIRNEGLLNPAIGAEYVEKILGKGGGDDPLDMLRDFLGRDPVQDFFLNDFGIL